MIERIYIYKTKVLLSYTQSFNIKHTSIFKINVLLFVYNLKLTYIYHWIT